MSEVETKKTIGARNIWVDPNPKGKRKAVGGAEHDEWNDWLVSTLSAALPVNQENDDLTKQAATAIFSGMIDPKPADAIEGMLISQMMVASQASLAMYRLGWAQPPEYFEARMKYFAQADKAARTFAVLSERLDHHRNRGQQKIVVQHTTTVNADQALIAENIVTGKAPGRETAKLLTATTDKPMDFIEPMQKETVPVGGGGTKAK
jgi:hypothetical protein